MSPHRTTFVAVLMLLCSAGAAGAAVTPPIAVGNCVVANPDSAKRPGWFVAGKDGLELEFDAESEGDNHLRVQPLWTSREGRGITFRELAHRAAPILIFSSLEFLRLRGIAIPSELGNTTPGKNDSPVVYFRVREVQVRRGSFGQADDDAIRDLDTRWGCAGGDTLRVDDLRHVIIRYFFYYPKDVGIGGHDHDLESLELQFQPRPICSEKAIRETCMFALALTSAAGSAHGAGWYTNVLEIADTDDTVLPLSVMVERDKHASSPDRDGNGKYMPHYDTNKYTKDAWGIRDVVASGKLGGNSFRAEFADDRTENDRVFPMAAFQPLKDAYIARGRGWPTDKRRMYDLQHSPESSSCKAGPITNKRLESLMDGKDFCRQHARISRPPALIAGRLRRAYEEVSPGPSGRYGFMSFSQRLSFSARIDHGLGATAIIPVGREVPLFGGWVLPRASLVTFWEGNSRWKRTLTTRVRSGAVEALYTPSGSRVNDWYVAGGWERARADENDVLRSGVAGEAGVRYRFTIEKLQKVLLFKFVGFRAGIRTTEFKWETPDGARSRRDTRLVFEIGAGSW